MDCDDQAGDAEVIQPVAVTAGSDATVRIWDLKTRRQIDRIDLPGDVVAIDVTAAGEIVATFGWDLVVLAKVGR